MKDIEQYDAPKVDREWICHAVQTINADYNRTSDTHLIKHHFEAFPDIDVYFKDESTHPTGSLKHRLARSLFLFAICNGKIHRDTPVIESSSGSTAISEAYFAKLLGLRFIAVLPKTTAQEKIDLIERYGGECYKVDGTDIYSRAQSLADELNGHYMDQFTYAERATDWRSNNNIAESLFDQMKLEPHPVPEWIVMGAGTGGNSSTIGRYLHYHPELYARTKLCIADVENSMFYPYYQTRDASLTTDKCSRIEGIGRPRVEPSFIPDVVDKMMRIPDAASLAAMRWLEGVMGRKVGASTGTNFYAVLELMQQMRAQQQSGSIVTVLCDGGERYLHTYYDDAWLAEKGIDIMPYLREISDVLGEV